MNDSLTSFIEEVCGDSHLRVEDDLGGGYVRLRISEAEKRQAKQDIRSVEDVVIEMLRNARDANSHHIFLAVSREGDTRSITMLDDGDGILETMHQKIFEPRVTSKLDSLTTDKWGVHGRGMALYSIKSNVEQAEIVQSAPGLGSSFSIVCNVNGIPEKTDQSSFPEMSTDPDTGEVIFRGPKNINRTVVEFAFNCRETCSVYLGSITDIAATLYEYGISTVSKSKRMFDKDLKEVPLSKRLSFASDPETFVRMASAIGLSISERSARRILDGDIKPLDDIASRIKREKSAVGTGKKSFGADKKKLLEKDVRGLKIHEDDIALLQNAVLKGYRNLARDYFLEPCVTPDIKIAQNELVIKIPLSKIH